jgi:pimeloyl-ACP methyl ester carboxylesterase
MVAAVVRRGTTRPGDQTARVPPYELQWGERTLVDVDGVGIHAEVAGPAGSGPVIVGLHGFCSGTFTWAGVAPHLAARSRLVAWDRPPFGRSDRPDPRPGTDDPYRLSAELVRFGALVDRFAGDEAVVLLGHSAGSLLALQAALDASVPVAGLVLIAPAVAGGPPGPVLTLSRLPGIGLVAASALRVGVLGAAAVLRRSTTHATPLTEATAAETGRVLRRPGTAAALWHLTATWEPPGVLPRLGELDIPALVIGGADDRMVTPEQHRAVADGLGADLHLLDGAGHAPHEQRPEEVAGLVRGFVADLGAR